MRRSFLLILIILLLHNRAYTQEPSYIQDPTLSVFFLFNDFKSAANVRASSLSSAIRNKQFGKIAEMSPGLGLSYLEGIHKHFDVVITLSGSFLDYPFQNRPQLNNDNFLVEADVAIRGKMFTNKSWMSPYLQLGAGSSFYAGYYAAYIPAGGGLQISFFDEAYFLVNAQYRIPVTEISNYHFYYSVGLAGKIGRKKQNRPLQRLPMPVIISAPDRDGDGVPDAEDVCPDTKGLAKKQRLPGEQIRPASGPIQYFSVRKPGTNLFGKELF